MCSGISGLDELDSYLAGKVPRHSLGNTNISAQPHLPGTDLVTL